MSNKDTLKKGERRKLEIIAEGRAMLIELGSYDFNMRELARKLEIRLGNLQYYFKTKEDLIEAIVMAEFTQNISLVGDLSELGKFTKPKLQRLVEQQHQFWETGGVRIYLEVAILSMRHKRFQVLQSNILNEAYRFTAVMIKWINNKLGDDQALRQARVMTAFLDGLLLQKYLSPPDTFFEQDNLGKIVTDMFIMLAKQKGGS